VLSDIYPTQKRHFKVNKNKSAGVSFRYPAFVLRSRFSEKIKAWREFPCCGKCAFDRLCGWPCAHAFFSSESYESGKSSKSSPVTFAGNSARAGFVCPFQPHRWRPNISRVTFGVKWNSRQSSCLFFSIYTLFVSFAVATRIAHDGFADVPDDQWPVGYAGRNECSEAFGNQMGFTVDGKFDFGS
jgi:hypothetical protein